MTCVILASWMLAVVGFSVLCSSIFSVVLYGKIIERGQVAKKGIELIIVAVLQTVGLVGGAAMFVYYIIPYIPRIVWPCIQVIP